MSIFELITDLGYGVSMVYANHDLEGGSANPQHLQCAERVWNSWFPAFSAKALAAASTHGFSYIIILTIVWDLFYTKHNYGWDIISSLGFYGLLMCLCLIE